MGMIIKDIKRPSAGVVSSFEGLGVATVHESIGNELPSTLLDPSIRPVGLGMKLNGPAVTVDCVPGDNSTVHVALSIAKAGDVLVVDGHQSLAAMWGGQMTFQAREAGVAGVVVDGSIRDSEEIRASNFPCFARHISPLHSLKKALGAINAPIRCGEVLVNPGDLVVGDDDGVVIVPQASLEEVLERARRRIAKEEQDRELYKMGKKSVDLNPELRKMFKAINC